MIRTALRAVALGLLFASPAWAQEAVVTRRATELRETPADGGRSLAALPAQAGVTRTSERSGPWVQVRTADGTTGWVHLFDLGPSTGAAPAGDGGSFMTGALRSVSSLFGGTGASRPSQTATTAGIRGLGAGDLAEAQPDPAAVQRMESLRVSDADARGFAGRAAWRPAPVDPPPAPTSVPGGTAGSGNPGQTQSP